jgi:ATP-dependent DNA helicase RecG
MAPTQILAEQHYLQFKRLLEPLGIGVALRTGARREDPLPLFNQGIQPAPPEEPAATGKERNAARNAPKRALQSSSQSSPQNGEARIFVGTHALLFEGTGLNRLGLAVIDEQHKFGVLQRAKLREHGSAPDVLVMTATPIPRTLTMTLFGDLDVSTLDELPANRGKIITAARDSAKLPEAVQFLKTQLQAGRQAYIVYPLIDESEKLEAKAAAAEFARWQEFLAPMRCELLHGRVPPEEKDAIMGRFRRGETHALVATTVIEVGIDVPNANLMLIENAERFGLAQLHQLRGRIGRGAHKSYCVLLSSKLEEPEAREKLEVLCAHHNGFEIAEADLRLRGPGDLLGTAQSGLPPIRIGDLLADTDLMILAREQAQAILARDPRLEAEEHRVLRGFLEEPRKITLAQVS